MKHTYDDAFMSYTAQSSVYSARTIVGVLRGIFPIQSVLDVGCATGSWLRQWQEAGTADAHGLDGDYVDTAALQIDRTNFTAADLSAPINLNRQFDLVQSLEVAEHIRADAADTFVENLVRHARGVILFSAAPPGQGGEFHINEQPYEYWRRKFATHGFIPFDAVRPQIRDDANVSFWYRFNTFIYVHKSHIDALPEAIRSARIPDAGAERRR